jgi:hypothetical protein
MADLIEQYRLKEFEKLRSEVEATLNTIWSNERYAVIACGAVWSWLIAQHNSLTALWCLPFIVIAAGWARNAALILHLIWMAEYVRQGETEVLGVPGGWEVFFYKRRNESTAYWIRFLGDNAVWGILLVVAFGALWAKNHLPTK